MESCENKYTTLLDLSRQAKIITGNTACFDGKISVGIPFSGYPTGVDPETITSLGIISQQDAVFSGNNITTLFDLANSGSTNFNPIFSSYSGSVWTNPLFSANTVSLTLPITPLSASTQVVGPIWTLTETGMTGTHVIGLKYTGYTVSYAPFDVEGEFSAGSGTYSAVTGFTTAILRNFSAGTLDYKGPLDYLHSLEDATIDNKLTTKQIKITEGASLGTVGYVLMQSDKDGTGIWSPSSGTTGFTNVFVTGGTLTDNELTLTRNDDVDIDIDLSGLSGGTGSAITGGTYSAGTLTLINGSGGTITVTGFSEDNIFTGNTSGDCITDLFVSNIFGCSDLNIEPSGLNDVYMVENGGSVSIGTQTIYSPTGVGVRTPFQASMGDSGVSFSGLPIATTALFESDTANSIGLVSPTINQIYFGTPEDAFGATIRWDYPNREFIISTNNTSGSTVFQTNNGVEAARINENGYFGIGTDTPQFTLDVAGETRLSGSAQNILSVIGSGDTTPILSVEGSVGELLTVNDSLSGLLFAVNDVSGLPTLQVFDNDTILMGNNLSPSLNTTTKVNPGTGLSTVYSIPMSAYTGAWFEYTVKNTGGARAGQIMSIFSGNTVNFTETTTTDIGLTSDVSFSMSADSVNSILQVSATTTGWEIKTIVRSI